MRVVGTPWRSRRGQHVTLQWAEQLGKSLLAATLRGVGGTSEVLPGPALTELLREACKAWKPAPTLLEVRDCRRIAVHVVYSSSVSRRSMKTNASLC